MKILIIDTADRLDAHFNQALFDAITGIVDCDITNYLDIPAPAELLQHYKATIISGVPINYPYSTVESRLPSFQWIKQTKLPVLGICLGHEIIAELFGADILHNMEAETGVMPTYIRHPDAIFNSLPTTFDSYLMHRASATIPRQFNVLANTAACANIIMKHKTKPIYGFQAHPEHSASGITLLTNFVAMSAGYTI